MEIKQIKSIEFPEIAKRHEYFIWNFVRKDYGRGELYSYFENYPNVPYHYLKEIVDTFKIPYFESFIEDDYDFICNLKDGYSKLVWTPKWSFAPVLFGFNRRRLVASTYDGICYCKEGMIELIYKTNPSFFENVEI